MIELFGRVLIDEVVLWENRFTKEENNVLEFLQRRLSILDIGSFLKEEKLRASGIIDMWMELYGKSTKSNTVYVEYLNDLAFLNIYKRLPIWYVVSAATLFLCTFLSSTV